MSVLERVSGPEDLAGLSRAELGRLAEEIREFLVTHVSATGGHLGPNLGVVELTLAVHRVFDSPRDTVVFDTGHQSYVHKLLTGRQDFAALRQAVLHHVGQAQHLAKGTGLDDDVVEFLLARQPAHGVQRDLEVGAG